MFFNEQVVYVVKKHRKTRTVTFCFIFFVSITNVRVGATTLVYHSVWLTASLASSNLMKNEEFNFTFKLLYYIFEISTQLVLVIPADRYVHIK